jgi:hypothetical protein
LPPKFTSVGSAKNLRINGSLVDFFIIFFVNN